MRPEENTYPILSVQTTYQCNMACANCYLGDMLNNPKFPDVDVKKFENVIKNGQGRIQHTSTHQGHSIGVSAAIAVQEIINNTIFHKHFEFL